MTTTPLTLDEVKRLTNFDDSVCISIFENTHNITNERKKDKLRFKNFIEELERELKKKDIRPSQRSEIIDPANEMLEDAMFWTYQSCGLAVFLSSNWSRFYKLPVTVGNTATIDKRFFVRPLLSYFDSNSKFFLLSLNQNGCQFYEGSVNGLFKVEVEGLEEALKSKELLQAEKQLQLHSTNAGGAAASYHGHREAEQHKTRIHEYFQDVEKCIHNKLQGETAPLILAGVDYLHSIYKENNRYKYLQEQGITGNTKDMDHATLSKQASKIVKPVFESKRKSIKTRFYDAKHSKRTVCNKANLEIAALEGKVDKFLLYDNSRATQDSNIDYGCLKLEDSADDVIGRAAVETLCRGGKLYLVNEKIDGVHEAGAILRY